MGKQELHAAAGTAEGGNMRIKERVCDICGASLGKRDFQFWIKPKVKFGYPEIGMTCFDICGDCFAELQVLIQERTKQKKPPKEET